MATFPLNIPESKDNIMLVDIHYHRPSREHDWTDQIQIVYKVLSSGEKKVLNITNPTIDIYFCKPGYENKVYLEYMPMDKLECVTVPYKDVEYVIAQRAGERYMNIYQENLRSNNRRSNKNIHKYPNVYGSDYDIVEWYKIMWLIHYDNDEKKPITRGFFDIEVNIVGLKGFPKDGERPVNFITIADPDNMQSHAMILREPMNIKNIDAFEADLDNFIAELEEDFTDVYGELDYNFYFYDNEAEMLIDFIRMIKTLNKDFFEIWNMDFDIPYINARLVVLGYDPMTVWCDDDFERHYCYYKLSRMFDIVSRDSKFNVTMKTVFLDQMVLYAAMRKGQATLRSNNLNAIGQIEIEDEKIDYGEASNLGELQMMNFRGYAKYAIKDTLLQMGIDNKTGDTEALYTRALSNSISYNKAFKQTRFLENRAYYEYFKQGLIMGNNVNVDYSLEFEEKQVKKKDDDEEDSYSGGLVADPKLNGYNGIEIMGSPSKYVYRNVVDFDFSSMYPNEIVTFNISRNSMIGKLIFNDRVDTFNPGIDEETTDLGHQFLEDYLTNHPITVGKRWLNLPGTAQFVEDFSSKFLTPIDREERDEKIEEVKKKYIVGQE